MWRKRAVIPIGLSSTFLFARRFITNSSNAGISCAVFPVSCTDDFLGEVWIFVEFSGLEFDSDEALAVADKVVSDAYW